MSPKVLLRCNTYPLLEISWIKLPGRTSIPSAYRKLRDRFRSLKGNHCVSSVHGEHATEFPFSFHWFQKTRRYFDGVDFCMDIHAFQAQCFPQHFHLYLIFSRHGRRRSRILFLSSYTVAHSKHIILDRDGLQVVVFLSRAPLKYRCTRFQTHIPPLNLRS